MVWCENVDMGTYLRRMKGGWDVSRTHPKSIPSGEGEAHEKLKGTR